MITTLIITPVIMLVLVFQEPESIGEALREAGGGRQEASLPPQGQLLSE